LLFVDLDDFKNVNDTLGHAAGDEVLRSVAARLQSVLRPSDSVVRLGGDEFTVILEPIVHDADAARVAVRIEEAMRQPFELSRGTISLGASIGISLYPRDGEDAEALLKNSDIAMYRAKAEGKGHHRFFEPGLFESLKARLDTERALAKALEEDQFLLVYQPRVSTGNGELRAMEALVRWLHPERGLVPPSEFIPLAEQTGLIVRLGALVAERACAQIARWRAQRLPLVPISINVSSRQFAEGGMADAIADCLARHGVPPDLLEVEITESSMMGENADVLASLAGIRKLGVKLLVDDFGTGYSSLSQLQRLDMDGLKIDRSFTAELCRTTEGDVFVRAIVSMAHALGMNVVAEGVETTGQLRVLQSLSCNEVQGYLISRPVAAVEVPGLLHKRFLFPSLPGNRMVDADQLTLRDAVR
jgi:diguanylate cyclase (GGDEF)-like protein